MKKFFAFAFVLMLFVTANASFGRLDGFSIYTRPWNVGDLTNILEFPNEIVNYQNSVQLNNLVVSGSGIWYNGGMNFKLNDNFFFGIYLNNPKTPVVNYIDDDEPYSKDTVGYAVSYLSFQGYNNTPYVYPINLFDLIFAMKLNDNFIIGMLFNYAYDSSNEDNKNLSDPVTTGDVKETIDNSVSDLSFKFNVTLKNFSFFNLVDLGLQYGLPSYKFEGIQQVYNTNKWYEHSHVTSGTDGANDIGFWTRLNSNFVDFYFNFFSAKLDYSWTNVADNNNDGTIDSNTGEKTKQSRQSLTLGFGKVIQNDKYMLFADAKYQMYKIKWESIDRDILNDLIMNEYNYKETISFIAGSTGIEFYLKKWLTLRGGLEYYWLLGDKNEVNDPDYAGGNIISIDDYEDNESYPEFLFIMLGASFHINNNFDIDISYTPYAMFNFIYFISGNSSDLLYSAAITYHWD